jgi:linoleate 10R-lipoxygenase
MGEFHSHAFLKKLWQSSGKASSTYREFASQIFAAVVPTATLYSQAVATIVNFYLDADKQAAREEIVKLVASKEKDAADKVMGYVYEALRKSWARCSGLRITLITYLRLGSSRNFFSCSISGCDTDILCVQVAGVYRTAAKDDNLEGVDVKGRQNIFASIFDANRDVSC